MATLHAEQWSVSPQQREGFVALVRESKVFWETLGAEFRVRTSLIAGEGTGLTSVYHFFPDAAARATALDGAAAEAANDPLVRAIARGALPAALVGRLFLDSIPSEAPIPAEYPVAALTAYEVSPARSAEAQAAFEAADTRERAFGVEPALWVTQYAGAGSGRRLRVLGHASHAAMADFDRRNLDGAAPHPLLVAVADGTLRPVTASITVPWSAS